MGATNLVHNVYLLGGAVSAWNVSEWEKSLKAVNGTVHNGYCTTDYILQLFRATMFEYPIGLGPIFESGEKVEKDMSEKEKRVKDQFLKLKKKVRVKNYDVTDEARGHLSYRSNLKEIVEAVEFIG